MDLSQLPRLSFYSLFVFLLLYSICLNFGRYLILCRRRYFQFWTKETQPTFCHLTAHSTTSTHSTRLHYASWNILQEICRWGIGKRICKNIYSSSTFGIATGYGLVGWGIGVKIPAGEKGFSLPYRVQNDSGVHPASYPNGTAVTFPRLKWQEAWSWPLKSVYYRGSTPPCISYLGA
jgi:hypothetical protein